MNKSKCIPNTSLPENVPAKPGKRKSNQVIPIKKNQRQAAKVRQEIKYGLGRCSEKLSVVGGLLCAGVCLMFANTVLIGILLAKGG